MLEVCAICAPATATDAWCRGTAKGWNAADQGLEIFFCRLRSHGYLARHVVRKKAQRSSCRVVLAS